MVSPRSYARALYRCGQIECEDVIRSVDDVHLIAPRAESRGNGLLARQARRLTRRLAGVELSFEPRIETVRLEQDYDVMFFYAQNVDDLRLLEHVPDWRTRCRKAVCLLEEVWGDRLDYVPPQLARFDLLAINFHGSVEPLQRSTGLPCLWVPPGIDTLRFVPGRPGPRRSIDVFGMGRRSQTAHRALYDHATQCGWTYLFDTIDTRAVRDGVHEHRAQLAELIKRTRYFIVNRAKFDSAEETGGQDELGFRSFEGAAAGAVMIGDAPRGPSAELLFDWPDAHIHVPADSAAIVEIMRELDRDPDRLARIRRENVANSLLRHDWAYRWQMILGALECATTLPLHERRQQLTQLAGAYGHADRSAA
jgi:hypothetical protein